MIWIGGVLVIIYALLLFWLFIGWIRLENIEAVEANTSVTVIVPVRNEERTIAATLKSVLNNDYNSDLLQILVVNDHSTDGTVDEVAVFGQSVEILHLEEGVEGKKQAITLGVNRANGEMILCTDGDTQVSQDWIKAHAQSYEAGARLSFGGVGYQKSNLWHEMIELELSALVAVGAVSAGAGKPSMINGCNYSFSKEAFENVDGFRGNEAVPTGDDEFLLRKISEAYPGEVRFLPVPESYVSTEPVGSWSEFVNQRRRWASKWKHHSDISSKLIPGLVFLFYLLLIIVFGGLAFFQPKAALEVMVAKCSLDVLFLGVLANSLSLRMILAIILLQIIYPFYVVFFGLASNFGSYRWRGRKYKI